MEQWKMPVIEEEIFNKMHYVVLANFYAFLYSYFKKAWHSQHRFIITIQLESIELLMTYLRALSHFFFFFLSFISFILGSLTNLLWDGNYHE